MSDQLAFEFIYNEKESIEEMMVLDGSGRVTSFKTTGTISFDPECFYATHVIIDGIRLNRDEWAEFRTYVNKKMGTWEWESEPGFEY